MILNDKSSKGKRTAEKVTHRMVRDHVNNKSRKQTATSPAAADTFGVVSKYVRSRERSAVKLKASQDRATHRNSTGQLARDSDSDSDIDELFVGAHEIRLPSGGSGGSGSDSDSDSED